ncbi:MAG: GH116 family glycosyl hydrolase, partial [bacterium]|nr:GH116 family glycosyl hydrolase [bacterium]
DSYCESVGRKSAILGIESGKFEIWIYPLKIVSDFNFSVYIPNYQTRIDCREIAARTIVRPEMTSIIFSHQLFTIVEHLLAPQTEAGAVILLDVKCCTDLEIWFSFSPELIPMWPAGLGGQYTLWLDEYNCYFIGEGSKKYNGLIGSPFAKKYSGTPGHQLPDEPMKFVVAIASEKAEQTLIPVIVAGGVIGREQALENYQQILSNIEDIYFQNRSHYKNLNEQFLQIKMPDDQLNLAVEWAKVALDKGVVDNPQLGVGLTAGYNVSGKTQRPGFAWFFGGDSCINSIALSQYGDFETIRESLTLLKKYQRSDGKIPHEITQSAALINWFEDYPYCYYHGDTTPYYIIAMHNYLARSGDKKFIEQNWQSILNAYLFCERSDTDGDGLMENKVAGLAAMELGQMLPETLIDIYLASVWVRAIVCMSELCDLMGDQKRKAASDVRLATALESFRKIFSDEKEQRLRFSRLVDGSNHEETTVWQSVPLFWGILDPEAAQRNLLDYASSRMSVEWGVRSISNDSRYYDPLNYNNGTVWPFTTGMVSVAQYKSHRSLDGFQNLKANAALTFLNSPGWQTELLSGEFCRPLDASVPHQLFSAFGIVTPLVSGMFGLEASALTRQISFAPHLPLAWEECKIYNYRCGEDRFRFTLSKKAERLALVVNPNNAPEYELIFDPALPAGSQINAVHVNSRPHEHSVSQTRYDCHCLIRCKLSGQTSIEIDYQMGIELGLETVLPAIGAYPQALKIIDYSLNDKMFEILVEGLSGMSYTVPFRSGFPVESAKGGQVRQVDVFDYFLDIKIDSGTPMNYEPKKIQLHLKR